MLFFVIIFFPGFGIRLLVPNIVSLVPECWRGLLCSKLATVEDFLLYDKPTTMERFSVVNLQKRTDVGTSQHEGEEGEFIKRKKKRGDVKKRGGVIWADLLEKKEE